MGTILFALVGIAVIAAILAVKYRGYCRQQAEDAPVRTVEGLLLSKHSSPLGIMAGRRMLSVELLSAQGEKQSLFVQSLPLFQSLSTGSRGQFRIEGDCLTDFKAC